MTDIKDNKLVTHTGTPYWNIHWKSSEVSKLSVITEEVMFVKLDLAMF